MRVQSILFDKDVWTVARAKAWLKRHGYRYGKVDETTQDFRFRQADPKQFTVFQTILFLGGISAVVAR